MNSIMSDVRATNFRPGYTTTGDQRAFDMLVCTATGVFELCEASLGRKDVEALAPVVTGMNLVRRYQGATSPGYHLCSYDMMNLGYDLKGEKTKIVYGWVLE